MSTDRFDLENQRASADAEREREHTLLSVNEARAGLRVAETLDWGETVGGARVWRR